MRLEGSEVGCLRVIKVLLLEHRAVILRQISNFSPFCPCETALSFRGGFSQAARPFSLPSLNFGHDSLFSLSRKLYPASHSYPSPNLVIFFLRRSSSHTASSLGGVSLDIVSEVRFSSAIIRAPITPHPLSLCRYWFQSRSIAPRRQRESLV